MIAPDFQGPQRFAALIEAPNSNGFSLRGRSFRRRTIFPAAPLSSILSRYGFVQFES
jgi:hypothetical protein